MKILRYSPCIYQGLCADSARCKHPKHHSPQPSFCANLNTIQTSTTLPRISRSISPPRQPPPTITRNKKQCPNSPAPKPLSAQN